MAVQRGNFGCNLPNAINNCIKRGRLRRDRQSILFGDPEITVGIEIEIYVI